MNDEENTRPGQLPIAVRWDSARTERLLGRVHARIDRARRVRRGLLASLPVVALVLLAAFGFHRWSRHDIAATPLPAGGHVAARIVLLGDGSRVELRDAETELRVRSDAPSLFRVELASGAGRFHVTHAAGRTFEVIAGPVTVAVVGTDFTVELLEERVRVQVHEGTVRVSWPEDSRTLSLGESGLFPPAAAEPAASSPGAGVTPAVQAYRSSVSRHDYAEAYGVLSRHPGVVGDSVDDLLTAADVARLSGHAAQAVPYLERIATGHPSDGRAPLAQFTLGRTLLGLGRAVEAEQAFAQVRRRWPNSPLAEDALVRQIEAAARAGDLKAAQKLAEEYDQAYPQGRRRSEARRHAGIE